MFFCACFSALFMVAAPHVSIMDIQGADLVSPLVADSVLTVGIVTSLAHDGFYVQDTVGDGSDATSDALFVRSNANVFVGDEVRLAGVVSEFLPSSDTANLTVTEITQPSVTRLRASLPLPASVCVTPGGRFPAASDGIVFWESLEAMRVCVHAPHVVQGTYSASECWVVPEGVALSARGALVVAPGDLHPERVKLTSQAMPVFSVGDVLADVTGVVSYRAGNYEVLLDRMPSRISPGRLSREIATLSSGADRVRVASFNLHNLSLEDPSRIQELGRVIVSQLGAPEILGVEEIVDDSGSENDGVVDATLTLRALVDAIRDADGPTYDFREVLPVDGEDGGAPGNNIRQALLFDRRRVTFIDRGDSFGDAATRFVADGAQPSLTRSPGRIDPASPAWVASRKPLACELHVDGHTLFVIVCHFVSKSRTSPLFGAVQPPVDPDANKRRRQAALVASFVGDALAIDVNARIIVMGDLNDDWFSETIRVLERASLTDLWQQVPEKERYSLLFDGNAHAFDHVLVFPAIAGAFDIVHVAAEFRGGVSDHDAVMASLRVKVPNAGAEKPHLSVSASPNPFLSAVNIIIDGNARDVAIFDVCGRRVCSIATVTGPITWAGKDDAGRNVPAGVYFVRVSDGVSTRARKLVLIR
jgi:predicted extracellular nuclease